MPARRARSLCLILWLAAAPAAAQDLQNLHPAAGTQGWFGVQSARISPDRVITPSFWVHYARDPVVRRDTEAHVSRPVIRDQLGFELAAAIGLADRVEFDLSLPLGWVSGKDIEAAGEDGLGLGDVRAGAKFRLFGLDAVSDEPPAPVALALSLPVSLPTGDTGKLMGSDGFAFTPTGLVELRVAGFGLGINAGARLRTQTERVENIELGHDFVWGAAADVALGTPRVVLLAEIAGAVALEEIVDEDVSRPVEAFMGLRLDTRFGGLFTLGGALGVNPDRGVPTARGLLGFSWRPPPRRGPAVDPRSLLIDSDQDGVLDLSDACPDAPEDDDRFEDEDGCPDLDNDRDGIRDSLDRCPNEPETVNGFDDADGCPDAGDRDRDGLRDAQDACPDAAEDRDGFQDGDGCPDPDNDGDRIPDALDKCPNRAETKNGVDDADGCPDSDRVVMKGDRLEIGETIYFDTGKARIQARSHALLDEVAQVILAHADIGVVLIEGHTDAVGNAQSNLRLSQRRADAVRLYLENAGVPAARLEARGFGATRPLVSGGGPEANARNRRVEFRITRR